GIVARRLGRTSPVSTGMPALAFLDALDPALRRTAGFLRRTVLSSCDAWAGPEPTAWLARLSARALSPINGNQPRRPTAFAARPHAGGRLGSWRFGGASGFAGLLHQRRRRGADGARRCCSLLGDA